MSTLARSSIFEWYKDYHNSEFLKRLAFSDEGEVLLSELINKQNFRVWVRNV